MESYAMLFFVGMGLIFAAYCQFDGRMGDRYIEKNKIPKDSILRKIYPFKEDSFNPLLYIKFVPFLISLFIFFIVFLIYIIYWIRPDLLSYFLQSKVCFWGSLGYAVIMGIYITILKF